MIEKIVRLVTDAGDILAELRKTGKNRGTWNGVQYKCESDLILHDFLFERLSSIAPEIPVISEEDPASWRHFDSGEFFIIDPIDGTASFAEGFSGFVTQVAFVRAGVVELSAVCAPALDLVYWAERWKGACLNDKILRISDRYRWITLIDNYPKPRGVTRSAFRELKFVQYLESGSISLKICRIADGSADIFFKDVSVQPWDIAAPHLILAESGGVLCDIRGFPIDYSSAAMHPGIVAANSGRNAKRLISWYSNHIKEGGTL